MTRRPIEILLAEDTPGDVWLIREILQKGDVQKNIHVAANGEQALEFIHRQGKYVNAPRPDLVLLDLNLPRRDGFEVLRNIKSDPVLRGITVIVLTTSDAPSDVNAAYDLNANCYVVKPENLDEFTVAIRSIESFWITLASLPTLAPQGPALKDAAEPSSGSPHVAAGSSNGSPSPLVAWAACFHTSRPPRRNRRARTRPKQRFCTVGMRGE